MKLPAQTWMNDSWFLHSSIALHPNLFLPCLVILSRVERVILNPIILTRPIGTHTKVLLLFFIFLFLFFCNIMKFVIVIILITLRRRFVAVFIVNIIRVCSASSLIKIISVVVVLVVVMVLEGVLQLTFSIIYTGTITFLVLHEANTTNSHHVILVFIRSPIGFVRSAIREFKRQA